ncbi:hypothetical protein FRC18_009297 [Serendipita sp. 400]|nr:hypothetical protein FRC18_009297 [Serendipita sp. 400]
MVSTRSLLLLVAHFHAVHSFSFAFTNKPTQCGSLTVTVDGGTPPYRLVMVPAGPIEGPEIRTIVDEEFSSSPHTLPPLAFPGGSNFVAVVGDANGVGTGGTSVITDVARSSNTSCLSTSPTTPLFYFALPTNPNLVQCGSIDLSFSGSTQGQVTVMGLIPGGQTFSVPVPSGATSVNWSPIRVAAGSNVMLVVGDGRGRGTGGSAYLMEVQGGSGDCLNDGSPVYSETPEPYAGGQYATGSGGGTVTGPWSNSPSNGSGSGASSSHKKRTAIIVGTICGVLGLLAILACIFLLRRRHKQKSAKYAGTKEVDLLKAEREPAPLAGFDGQTTEPTPYYAPSNGSPVTHGAASSGHRPSTSISTMNHGGLPDRRSGASNDPLVPPSAWNPHNARAASPSGRSRFEGTDITTTDNTSDYLMTRDRPYSPIGRDSWKTAEASHQLRPMNLVQHEDAGAVPTTTTSNGEEVVELPPSYNDVKRAEGGQNIGPQ